MASGYVVTLDHVASADSPSVEAVAMYGDNGPENGGDPEYTLQTSSDSSSGRTTWNPTFFDDGSWDSNNVAVSLSISPDGAGNDVITWSIDGATALTQTIPELTSITGVEIAAGTQIGASVAWSDVAVTFSDGATVDSYSGSNPAVDTTTATNGAAEQELFVTPTSADNTTVGVTGNIDMAYPAGTYPNPADLSLSIDVFSGT